MYNLIITEAVDVEASYASLNVSEMYGGYGLKKKEFILCKTSNGGSR